MRLLTSPESTEAEGEIAIFGYGYPVANDIYHVVAILLAVLGSEPRDGTGFLVRMLSIQLT